MECYTCHRNEQIATLPSRELVAVDDRWRVAHAFDAALPGWLVLVPRRHVTSRALRTVTGCLKTYMVQLAEKNGFAHAHFHVVPRMPDLPDDRRGPAIFGYLGAPQDQCVNELRQDELAVALRAELDRRVADEA